MSYFTLNSRAKNLLQNTLLCFASILFALAACEIGLRGVDYNPLGDLLQSPKFQHFLIRPSHSRERIYEGVPNSTAIGWQMPVHFNSYGFRDREYGISKNGAYRIVVLGDSIAFGLKIGAEDVFAKQMETLFAKNNAGRKVEVLNLGLPGYDTVQEVATLEDIGLQFSPDVVVVTYCINDIIKNSPSLPYIQQVVEYHSWIYHSRLAQFIRVHLDNIESIHALESDSLENDLPENEPAYPDDASVLRADKQLAVLITNLKRSIERAGDQDLRFAKYYGNIQNLAVQHSIFNRLKKLQAKYGFRVILYIVPIHATPGAQEVYENAYKIVEYQAGKAGFAIENGSGAFHAAGLNNLFGKKDILHPTENGHRLIAEQLYHYLQSTEPALAAPHP